ncbi:MAG: PQQ-binding-like beta-propeller repeat protein [Bellilinea sp.]
MNKKKITLIFIVILASLLLASCSSGLSGSSWPGIFTNGDTVYLANMAYVYAIRASDGSQIWRYPEKATKAMYYASPVLVDGQLIVGDYQKVLHSLNPTNGSENWRFEADGPWIASPLVMDGIIYAPNGDQNLYALDLNGNLLWQFTAEKALWSQPVGNGDTVYQASMDQFLYAIDMKNGTKKWETDLGGAVIYSPTLSDEGVIYLSTLAREVIAINSKNGDVLWRRQFEENLWSQPALYEDKVFVGDLSGNAYAISNADGTNIWTQTLTDPVTGKPTVTSDSVIFATENGSLFAMNFDGERLWSKTFEGKLYTGPILMDDKLLVGVALGESPLKMINAASQDVWTFIPPK